METNFEELKSLFISDPSSAIAESQKIICSVTDFNSFADFYNYHQEHSHISTCQNEWSKPQMAVHCINCSIDPQSCFCLQCFLNSNHEGHEYLIRPNSTGNCDCGDLSLWKRSGFCPKHQGLESDAHPEEYLDEKLRITLTDTVFKAAFSALKHLFSDNGQKISLIIQFLISFLKFGDGFRRLIAISLTEKINIYKFFYKMFDATNAFNEIFQQFCGLLINDQLFKNNFARVNYKLMIERIAPLSIKQLETHKDNNNLNIWSSVWFHSYSLQQFQHNIQHFNWDWVDFSIKMLTFTKEIIRFIRKPSTNYNVVDIFITTLDVSEASNIQPDAPTQKLFDQLFTQILTCGTTDGINEGFNDTNIAISFKENTEETHFVCLVFFNLSFYQIVQCFKGKNNLKFDILADSLDKTIDISQLFQVGRNIVGSMSENENDKFIIRYIKPPTTTETKDYWFNSFYCGSSFYISHPMYFTFSHLFRVDDLCRKKIAQFLTESKYQSLRVNLGIFTLKYLLALVCLHESLVPRNNFGAIKLISNCLNNPQMVNFGIPLVFPIFQLVVGLESQDRDQTKEFSLKEFFSFEMAREIGLFDDFTSIHYKDVNVEDSQRQMIFTFLYLSILLVIERTLFNFDANKFIEEQVIFALKQGVSDLNQLKDVFDREVSNQGSYMHQLNKIISTYATARQKKKKQSEDEDEEERNSSYVNSGDRDVSFDLKEGVECSNFSAINSFNELKVIMNNEITKHPAQLIKVSKFEPEETYFYSGKENLNVKLKTFLMTPTVLSIVYHTLRSNVECESPKVDLNDHLAMNILLLVSQFVTEEKGSSSFDGTAAIKYNSTVSDLVSQVKRVVFNYQVDDEGNATITNNLLTRESFKKFLELKISNEKNEKGKSLIDILVEKGEIGKSLLKQMSIEVLEGKTDQKNDDDIKKLKKERAHRLKENIMNHYKSMTATFKVNDEQLDELTNSCSTEREVCAVCSTSKEKEILSFPIYFYRTKFPFIIDKPPIRTSDSPKDIEVFQDELISDDDENDEEEEERVPSPDLMLNFFLSQHPEYRITDDLDDEEIRQRRMMISIIQQTIERKYNETLQQIEERKIEKEERKKMKIEKKKQELIKNQSNSSDKNSVPKRCSPGNNFVIQFGICQHLVHHDCIKEKVFDCPVDRSTKNGFLPNINDIPKSTIFASNQEREEEVNSSTLSTELSDTLTMFVNYYSSFFVNKDADLMIELVKSISGLISTYEIRLRSLPDCLDSKKTFFLSRNLFLTSWYIHRMKNKTGMKEDGVDSKLSPFQRFVKQLIECDCIEFNEETKEEALRNVINSLVSSINEDNKNVLSNEAIEKVVFLFLRRVCLAEHFLLDRDVCNSHYSQREELRIIDWDDVLSIENLSRRYGVTFPVLESKGSQFELKPFLFTKLPKEFLRFAQSPFNFPVDQTKKIVLFNLIDYNFLIRNYDETLGVNEDDPVNLDEEEEKNKCQLQVCEDKRFKAVLHLIYSSKNYPSVILFIGALSSNILVTDGKKVASLRPFYLDRYGCADIGFKRNQPLFLNEERYERLMDEVLSGEFTRELMNF